MISKGLHNLEILRLRWVSQREGPGTLKNEFAECNISLEVKIESETFQADLKVIFTHF